MKVMLWIMAVSSALQGGPTLIRGAEGIAPPSQVKREGKARSRPFNGRIRALDKTAMTLTLTGQKAQTFKVTAQTRITKDGKPATFHDLAVADSLGGSVRETADGKWEAVTINAGQKATGSTGAKKQKPK